MLAVSGAGTALVRARRAPRAPAATELARRPLYDVRERAMVGDTGSTPLGAMACASPAQALDVTGTAVAVAIVVTIALYAEVLSLSALIERMPPLRVLDWLGRKNPDA